MGRQAEARALPGSVPTSAAANPGDHHYPPFPGSGRYLDRHSDRGFLLVGPHGCVAVRRAAPSTGPARQGHRHEPQNIEQGTAECRRKEDLNDSLFTSPF